MPETITGSYSGDAAEFQRVAGRRTLADPGAAVVVIYIVLGVLYKAGSTR